MMDILIFQKIVYILSTAGKSDSFFEVHDPTSRKMLLLDPVLPVGSENGRILSRHGSELPCT